MAKGESNLPLREFVDWGKAYLRSLPVGLLQVWDRFWFTPRSAYWLSVLRVPAGLMLLYTHLVWTIGFDDFLGTERQLSEMFGQQMNPSSWYWSHFDWIQSNYLLWALHWVGIVVIACFVFGLGMPWTGWLAAAFAISYAHRATGALFGLDQMNVALVTYLTLGGAGRHLSVDHWLRNRRKRDEADIGLAEQTQLAAGQGRAVEPVVYSVWTTIATRLIQLQLCIIYWFAGTGKLQGASWWNGEAMWGAFASYQYQSIDMTWLHAYPHVLALLTHFTIIWELGYVFLVWPRWSRPLVIGAAIMVHTGIAVFLGMMTFGLIMVVANLAFVEWQGLYPPKERLPNS